MLLTYEMAMNFVMMVNCIDVDTTSLNHIIKSLDKAFFGIDTDAYIDGQEFHNLRQLMLLNSIGDPSMMREKLAYEMMAFSGLPASLVAHVELWIDITDDDQPILYWCFCTMVERVDNKYLNNRFGRDSKGGNLNKANHAQRAIGFSVLWQEQGLILVIVSVLIP